MFEAQEFKSNEMARVRKATVLGGCQGVMIARGGELVLVFDRKETPIGWRVDVILSNGAVGWLFEVDLVRV